MKIHFIGIGGIGSSALAQYFLKTKNQVSGSDIGKTEITEFLKKMGIKIFIGQKKSNLPKDVDLVLPNPAIKDDNIELIEAKKRKIKIQTWEEALGELTKKYFTIAISGAHGKSTTTALISLILMKARLDPTVIIGTKLKEFGNSNFRMGKSKYLVIESDEYRSSFLNYWPQITVLTNLEYEHPDYFKNFNHYLNIFKEYLLHLKLRKGIVVANKDNDNVRNLVEELDVSKKYYSLNQKDAKRIKEILKIPGQHTVSNALAALAVARILKIPDQITFKALSEYKGAWRRFETFQTKISGKNITIISDYGHHPTQVKATIQAAKEKYSNQKVWIIYQPHQYMRTYFLFDDYVKAFDEADEVVLPEIYKVEGREQEDIVKTMTSKKLVQAIEKRFKKINKKAKVYFIKDYQELPQFLKQKVGENDVIIIMGAGSIYKIIKELV